MKKSVFALIAAVLTLTAQSSQALDGHCFAEAQAAAESMHAISHPASSAQAEKVEMVGYAGWKTKRYEVTIEGKQYGVNMFEFESASNPRCEITSVEAQ